MKWAIIILFSITFVEFIVRVILKIIQTKEEE